MEVRFYHLTTRRVEDALPLILDKALKRPMRAVLQTSMDEERVEELNKHLWEQQNVSFLPHGSEKDGNAENHPIWITNKSENPNKANLLVLVDGAETSELNGFDLCCYFFDGRSEEAVLASRHYWKTLKSANDADLTLTYWQQDDKGNWASK